MDRILFVDTSPFSGGAQRSLLTVIMGLDHAEFRPFLLSADTSAGGLIERCRQIGIDHDQLDVSFWRRNMIGAIQALVDVPRSSARIRRLHKDLGASVIYTNGIRAGLLGAAAGGRRIPLILHHRDVRCPGPLLRAVARRARAVVAVSDFAAEHTRDRLGPELAAKVKRIYNGIDIAASSGNELQTGWDPDRIPVLLVADMVGWKRHRLFLQAMAEAKRVRDDLQTVIIGGAFGRKGRRYLDALHAQAKGLGLGDTVSFIGRVDDAVPYIQAGAVLVSVADREPFGRSVVEALACGKPVVVTSGGGPEEIVGGCAAGRVVSDTPGAIAEGILEWAVDADARAAAATPAQKRAEMFSAAKYVKHVSELIREVA